MSSLRSALQGIFVFFTLLFALFLRKGWVILSLSQMQIITKILTPAYLIFAGVMIGMFLHTLFSHVSFHHSETMSHHDRVAMEKDVTAGMMLWLMIGAVLALLYIAKIS
jgi:fatty-acid desaturase